MEQHYAIMTFRKSGPLKSWAAVRAAQVHNSREKPIPHAEADIPPHHMIGSGNLAGDIKDALRKHGIDPAHLRKNGVIAYEAVLTASLPYFQSWSAEERGPKFSAWLLAQEKFLLDKYGKHRVVSIALHLDERTPHLHAVILPLHQRVDGRSKDGAQKWTLVGRTISGPGKFDQLQDEYAAAMAPLGLCRGVRKSGRKHKPVSVYMGELAAQEAENARRGRELQEQFALLRHRQAEVAEERETLRKERLAVASAIEALQEPVEMANQFMRLARAWPQSQWTKDTMTVAAFAEKVIEAAPSIAVAARQAALHRMQQGASIAR